MSAKIRRKHMHGCNTDICNFNGNWRQGEPNKRYDWLKSIGGKQYTCFNILIGSKQELVSPNKCPRNQVKK